jgi:hypoxanthine phosphoribosyltransferase
MRKSEEPLFNAKKINSKVVSIACKIDKDFYLEDLVVVCVLKGAFLFTSDLIRYISFAECIVDFVKISSYGSGTKSSGNITLTKDLEIDIKGKNVLIVDDILDTGASLSFLVDLLGKREPKTIRTCVLLDKPERRKYYIEADYVGFEIENKFVIGYGLDYNEKYRELPGIYTLDEI